MSPRHVNLICICFQTLWFRRFISPDFVSRRHRSPWIEYTLSAVELLSICPARVATTQTLELLRMHALSRSPTFDLLACIGTTRELDLYLLSDSLVQTFHLSRLCVATTQIPLDRIHPLSRRTASDLSGTCRDDTDSGPAPNACSQPRSIFGLPGMCRHDT